MRRRILRRSTSLALLSCLGLLIPAIPAASSGSETLRDRSASRLSGVNVITSKTNAVMPVKLDRDATVSAQGAFVTASFGMLEDDAAFHLDNSDITIQGRGRITGMALIERGTTAPGERAMLIAVDLRMCDEPGCTTKEGPYFYMAGFLESENGRFIIPKGDYLLYAITDGSPVSIGIRLDGLAGRSRLDLSANRTSEISVSVPPDVLSDSTTRAAHTKGESYEMSGDETLLLLALRIRGERWVSGRYGFCLYNDRPATPAPVAYSYPCLGGFGVYIDDTFVRSSFQNLFHTAIYATREGGGTWSLGGGYLAAAEVTRYDHVQLAIDLPAQDVPASQSSANRGLPLLNQATGSQGRLASLAINFEGD